MIFTAIVAATVVTAGASVYGAVQAGNAAKNAATAANNQANQQQLEIDKLVQSNNDNLKAEQDANAKIVEQMKADSANQIDLLTQQNVQLQNGITAQSQQFQTAQQSLLDAQNQAADQAARRAQAAADAAKNVGQLPHAPNYGANILANQRKNAGGLTSTMLTGAGGVDSSSLALGKTTLLGA